jgi:hypothetical protein
MTRFPVRKGGTAVAVRTGIAHRSAFLVSIEATGICMQIGNSEVLLAAVCKSPGHAWNDADVIELLSFRLQSLPMGDLNAEHPFWNSIISNPSGAKICIIFMNWNKSEFLFAFSVL